MELLVNIAWLIFYIAVIIALLAVVLALLIIAVEGIRLYWRRLRGKNETNNL